MQHISIKDWSTEDRPREKLELKGVKNLSNVELLAIIINTGTANLSAVDIAKQLLHKNNNSISQVSKLSFEELIKFKGIGKAKAVTILAALEIGVRKYSEEPEKLKKIISSKNVFDIMHPIIGDIKHEEFWVLYLSRNNSVLKKERISQGGISGTVIDVRIIFNNAINTLCSSVILCHNHPSGNKKPSSADITITNKIKNAGEILDCIVLDHIIIAQNDYFSFADDGVI